MNLHDEIMRIPCDPKKSPCRGVSAELAYKSGHRDAQHAAAELSAAAGRPVAQEPVAWVSTADRLPELDTPVWLYDPDVGTFFGMRESSTDGWGWVEGSGLDLCPQGGPGFTCVDWTDCKPTFWMPLPAAPGDIAPPAAEQPDTIPAPRELLERAADRFSKAQIFDFSSELRALLEKEGAQP